MQETEGDSAGPSGPQWEEIEQELRIELHKAGTADPASTAAALCRLLWVHGTDLKQVATPEAARRRGRPQEWTDAAKELEALSMQMRGLLASESTGELFEIHVIRKRPPLRDDKGGIILGTSRVPLSVSGWRELLSVFDGFAGFVEEAWPRTRGRDGDPVLRAARFHFAREVFRLFVDHRLPLGRGTDSLLTRTMQRVFRTLGVKGDPKRDLKQYYASGDVEWYVNRRATDGRRQSTWLDPLGAKLPD